MGRLILRWIVLAVSLVVAAGVTNLFVGGFVVETKPQSLPLLLLGVAVLSFLNATLGKVLKLVTLPLNCLTLGLFSLVVNALVMWLAGSLGLGFRVEHFGAAFLGSLLTSIVNGLLGVIVPDDEK